MDKVRISGFFIISSKELPHDDAVYNKGVKIQKRYLKFKVKK